MVTEATERASVSRADVLAAQARLGSQVRRTPVIYIEANQLSARHPAFWVKLESLQHTGAFKARGALNSLLATNIPLAGVVAASGGNHGQAVAWAARSLGVAASIFVPSTCPEIKLRRLADYGATVTVVGDVYDESLVAAVAAAEESGAVLIHPFDQQLTISGAGTVTAEFIDQVPDLNSILIQVGGGGLLAGAAAALDESSTVPIAVEPSSARCLGAALDAGGLVDVDVAGPAVDSLGPRRVGQLCYDAVIRHRIPHVDVSDDAIIAAQFAAWNELRIGLEGGGATALAAILSGAYTPRDGELVGVLATGGNVDLPKLLAGTNT